ncbi:choice-of-anchor I domain-containing protein, partial [Deinococcus sp.]|uniref:choice-of-anchor I domain-containing protein n=1 Tax=Deinococcus sp. TaxID=47478 RepID=UPI0038D4D372
HPAVVDSAHFGDPTAVPDSGNAGDLQPDDMLFIAGTASPSGQPLLIVSSEVSGSVTLYTVQSSGTLNFTGRYQTSPYAYGVGVGAVSAYDQTRGRLLMVNRATSSLDVLDIRDVTRLVLSGKLSLAAYGRTPTWVAVQGGVIAVTIEAFPKTDPGKVLFLNADGSLRAAPITVGPLPEMLTFTPDGKSLVVASAGEANSALTIDPPGTISVINVARALATK